MFKIEFKSLDTLQEFDDGSSSSFNMHSLSRSLSLPEKSDQKITVPNDPQNHLFTVALLEHLCSIYMPDQKDSKRLFNVLCGQLVKNGVMSPMHTMDEISSLRLSNRRQFGLIMHAAINAISQTQMPFATLPNLHERAMSKFMLAIPRGLRDSSPFQRNPWENSRFLEEFCEPFQIGHGGYGSVFKARHKLDGCYYAIKKIFFKDLATDIIFRILGEAKYLAGLNHRNIVRYYTAWLEVEYPSQVKVTDLDTASLEYIQPKLPALRDHSCNNTNELAITEESDSIVFAEDSNLPLKESSVDNPASNSKSNFQIDAGDRMPSTVFVLHIQMELCSQTLAKWLFKRNQTIKEDEIFSSVDPIVNKKIVKQILRALYYIHSEGIIHRDLKTTNIFLRENMYGCLEAKLGDFGLARYMDAEPLTPTPGGLAEPLTPTSGGFAAQEGSEGYTSGVGTAIYASPEQLTSTSYNTKADMFSFGLILFELYHPFSTEMERYQMLKNLRIGLLSQDFRSHWPVQASYIEQLVSHEPNDRPSAAQLLNSELVLSKDQIIRKQQADLADQETKIVKLNQTLRKKNDKIKHLELEMKRLQLLMGKRLSSKCRNRHLST